MAINKDHSAIAKLPKHSDDLERIIAFLKPTKDEYPKPPKVDWHFSGRQHELGLIREYFDRKPIEDQVTFVVLHGLSGMGKTLLAHEYAKRNKNRYTEVIFASSESEKGFVSSFATEMPGLGIDTEAYAFQHVSEIPFSIS